MPLPTNPRNYSMSDADLCMFTSNLCQMLTEDLPELSFFGLDALKIGALKALGDAFEVYPSDFSLKGLVEIATRTKDENAVIIRQLIRDMSARMEMKFGAQSAEWNRLGILNMNNFSDKELIFAARRVHGICTEYLIPLSEYGLTEDILDDMEVSCQDYEEALNDQLNKINNRLISTKTRIEKGNELYGFVSKYCEMGKRYWADRNPVKYNQYIIYDSPSPGHLDPPSDITFYFPSTTFSISPVEGSTSYYLEFSPDGISYELVYEGSEPEVVFTPPQSGWSFFRARCRNSLGYSDYSLPFKIGYYPGTVLPAPENLVLQLAAGSPNTLELSFLPVASATQFSINRNITAIGSPAGPFNFVTNVNEPIYVETIIPGHRFYFNVTASNSHQWSGTSVNVFIDVPE